MEEEGYPPFFSNPIFAVGFVGMTASGLGIDELKELNLTPSYEQAAWSQGDVSFGAEKKLTGSRIDVDGCREEEVLRRRVAGGV